MASVCVMSKKSGFACVFVAEPPEAVQSECSVCRLILRDPYQVSCCGYSFCRDCIETKKSEPCPLCKKPFTTFHNKGLQRALYGFQVYCSHKKEGCEWKGELGQLDNHLNLSPKPGKQLKGCEYSEVKCSYCSELIKRRIIIVHQGDLCLKRPFSCKYCHTYKTHYEDVVNNHWPVCGYHPVQCPKGCGKTLECQAVKAHVNRDCPKTVIDCDFRHVGCGVKLLRKDMPAHQEADLVNHMSLQAASYKQLQERVREMESKEETLTQQLQASQTANQRAAARMQQMQQQMATLKLTSEAEVQFAQQILKYSKLRASNTIKLTMQNYHRHKRAGDTWYSTPFYSHPYGYKFSLGVCANGYGTGRGTHISVIMYLLRGEFDHQLKWPLRGVAKIQILKRNEKGYRQKLQLNNITPDGRRVTVLRPNGFGFPTFTLQTVLQLHYLRNDCLYFKITFPKIKLK